MPAMGSSSSSSLRLGHQHHGQFQLAALAVGQLGHRRDLARCARPACSIASSAGSTSSGWRSMGFQKPKLWPQCACMASATFSSTLNSGNTEVIW
jgi:hypothetical protein